MGVFRIVIGCTSTVLVARLRTEGVGDVVVVAGGGGWGAGGATLAARFPPISGKSISDAFEGFLWRSVASTGSLMGNFNSSSIVSSLDGGDQGELLNGHFGTLGDD